MSVYLAIIRFETIHTIKDYAVSKLYFGRKLREDSFKKSQYILREKEEYTTQNDLESVLDPRPIGADEACKMMQAARMFLLA